MFIILLFLTEIVAEILDDVLSGPGVEEIQKKLLKTTINFSRQKEESYFSYYE